MYYLEELSVHKMIVHILDPSLSVPILSMEEMPSNIDAHAFFASHILKTLNDDSIKTCSFDENYNMFLVYLKAYIQDPSGFALFSKNIAEQLFTIMSTNENISASDLAVVSFNYKGTAYIAILKLNYQNTYIHYTDFESDVHVNNIIQYKTTLPNINQRIQEATIINLTTLDINILEKPVEVEGAKENYLSKRFLKCKTKLSSKEQFACVKKATDQIAKKYFEDDIEKKMTIKKEFMEAIHNSPLETPIVQLTEKTISRSFEKQRIKTDRGIEVKIPMEIYNDPNNFEFITQPDGTISMLIKNIGKIIG